jgi:3-hydroxy-3-methylglutaryl CoA synthase
MFTIRCEPEYKQVQQTAQFKNRLASRVKISAHEYDALMHQRET